MKFERGLFMRPFLLFAYDSNKKRKEGRLTQGVGVDNGTGGV
jgi:hypothetical protein